MIKTLIADNHLLVREGFKTILEEELDMFVAGECTNADEVLDFISENECDVIVLDIDMPGKNGIDLLTDLRKLVPKVKVLIQSIFPEEQFAMRAIKAGASGYITKEAAAEDLVEAIRRIYSGKSYVSRNVADQMAYHLGGGTALPHERLSDREFQVLQLIGAGRSVSEISENLSLSLNTVNTYRKRILEKLGLNSTAQLIHYAVKNNLVV